MAANLPIKIQSNLPRLQNSPVLQNAINITLPPIKPEEQSRLQKDRLKPFPIFDINKKFDINSIFEQKLNANGILLTDYNSEIVENSENQSTIPEKIKKLKQEIKEKFISGKKNSEKYQIEDFTDLINNENYKVAEIAFNTAMNENKKAKGIDLFSLISFINHVNAKNKELAEIMAKKATFLTQDNLFHYTTKILQTYNYTKYSDLIKELCQNEIFTTANNIGYIFDIIIETAESDNREVAEKICKNKKFVTDDNIEYIENIIRTVGSKNEELLDQILNSPELFTEDRVQYFDKIFFVTDEGNIEVAKFLCANPKFSDANYIQNLPFIIDSTNKENAEFILKILKDEEIAQQDITYLVEQVSKFKLNNFDGKKLIHEFESLKNRIFNAPKKYINGEHSFLDSQKEVDTFFNINKSGLLTALMIFDKESIDNLLRRRFNNANKYLSTLNNFSTKELYLLKKLINLKNASEKPLMPTQKVEFIDLINAYKTNKLDCSLIENEIKDGNIDLGKLKINLFKHVLKNCDFSEEDLKKISKEKILAWDSDYLHFLPNAMIFEYIAYRDLLYATNIDDFMRFIFNKNTVYGEANIKTQEDFKSHNLNFNKWINPDKSLELKVASNKNYSENLSELKQSVLDNINALRNSPIKGIIENRLKEFINSKGEFIIPKKYTANKENLIIFLEDIFKKFEDVLQRAKSNKNIKEKEATAKYTLKIFDNLEKALICLKKNEETYTIKMWDRIPQKDLFQGHYSTCCISTDGISSDSMPHYLMNTAFNMIEIIDDNSGQTIGNALCYFVIDELNNPYFIIDNIEINNSYIQNFNKNIEFRDKIFEYATNIAKQVSGKDIPVYLGGEFNDVDVSNLKKENKNMKLLGQIDCEKIYMDLFKGTYQKDTFAEGNYLKIK